MQSQNDQIGHDPEKKVWCQCNTEPMGRWLLPPLNKGYHARLRGTDAPFTGVAAFAAKTLLLRQQSLQRAVDKLAQQKSKASESDDEQPNGSSESGPHAMAGHSSPTR